jgi:hypothetical protein
MGTGRRLQGVAVLRAHVDDTRGLSSQEVGGAANIGYNTIKCKVLTIGDLEGNF